MSERWPGGIISKTANVPQTTPPYCGGVWTLDQAAYWKAQGQWPYGPYDPYFANTTLLLNGDGTNGAQNNTFLDSSTNNFTITRNGNTTQGSFSPYGTGWSAFFGGGNTCLLSSPANAAFNLGTGNYTLETYVYFSRLQSDTYFLTIVNPNQDFPDQISLALYGLSSGAIGIWAAGLAINRSTPVGVITTGAWTHVAITRSSGTTKVFVNGAAVTSFTDSNNYDRDNNCIFRSDVGNGLFYLNNTRLVKGTALYTSDFTPPTSNLTAVSGTSLLTYQDSRFKDNSSNNFTLTPSGITPPSIQRFSPFNPTAPYSTSVIGGSGYFDGASGTNLATTATQIIPATGDFTVEGWIYPNTTGPLLFSQATNSNAGRFQAYISGNSLYVVFGASGNFYSSTNKFTLNAWNYYAITRTGSTFTMYVNGILDGTYSSSMTINNQILRIGTYYSAGEEFNGYMSDFRVTNSNIYSSTFTLPTAPTSSSSANFLAHMTNAGIPDLAMMNNLQTVGSAQVSTSVKKYGTGSLAFNGSTDYLISNPANANLYAFGSGDFTIEFWLNLSGTGTYLIYDGRPASTQGAYPTIYTASGVIYYYVSSANRITGPTLSTSTWYYVTVCRSGTSTKMFINGTQAGSTYTDSTTYLNTAGRPVIGADGNSLGTNPFNGYLDDLRVTKGYARYTANFTPPTAALPTY